MKCPPLPDLAMSLVEIYYHADSERGVLLDRRVTLEARLRESKTKS
jgi:hypothetical protein